MIAILDPVTVRDVERYAGPFLPAYVAAEDAVAEADAMGRHLEAAAGRAIHGARWTAVVAAEKPRAYAAAVSEWEASPDSSTRGALNVAADMPPESAAPHFSDPDCGDVDKVFGDLGPLCNEPAGHDGDHVATDYSQPRYPRGLEISRW